LGGSSGGGRFLLGEVHLYMHLLSTILTDVGD
jgi:hypothetical protein